MLTNIDILDGHKEQVILACTYNNRTVITLNLYDNVYSQDKKDDLKIKQAEHARTVEEHHMSLAEAARTNPDAAANQNQDFLEQEQDAILDLKYKMSGNRGFHSSGITHFDCCLQRPIIMSASIED